MSKQSTEPLCSSSKKFMSRISKFAVILRKVIEKS